jgi:purine nucleosidase
VERVFLIDTDTASDDAVALIMALRAPDVRVAAITTVAGNVSVTQAARNALYTAEVCGSNVPVFAGAPMPLLRAHENATWFHGEDGLGNHFYPAAHRALDDGWAADVIIDTTRKHPGLTLVTLGPLTNIALALLREPSLANNVGRCVVMGGAPCCEGNVTPAAEYNVWVDPEAARIVMRSRLPIEMVGWQLSRFDAVLNASDIARCLAHGSEAARFAIECSSRAQEAYKEQTGEIGISLPDPIAMAVALDPSVCAESSAHYTDVEVSSELTRGMTVVDRLNAAANHRNRHQWRTFLDHPPNVKVCWRIDVPRWKSLLLEALR